MFCLLANQFYIRIVTNEVCCTITNDGVFNSKAVVPVYKMNIYSDNRKVVFRSPNLLEVLQKDTETEVDLRLVGFNLFI